MGIIWLDTLLKGAFFMAITNRLTLSKTHFNPYQGLI